MNAKWLTCLLCTAAMTGAEAGLAVAQDTMAPIITAASRSPGAVDTTSNSQQVSFTLGLGDNLSGFNYGYLYLYSPSGSQNEYAYFSSGQLTSGNALNGVYTSNLTLEQYAEAGTWTPSLHLYDAVGNNVSYDTAALAAMGYNDLNVEVTSLQDTLAPTITAASRTPGSVDTTSGSQQMSFTLDLGDNLSGFNYGYLYLYSPSGAQNEYAYFSNGQLTSGNALSGVYTSSLTLEQYVEAGSWTPSLHMYDAVGNNVSYDTAALAAMGFNDLGVEVASLQDTLAPTVTAASRSPGSVNTTSGNQQVSFTLELGDNLSGFSYAYLYLYSPSGAQNEYAYLSNGQLTSGDVLSGIYTGNLTLDQYAEAGTWTPSLHMYDAVGNSVSYDTATLAAMGFSLQVNVVPEPASVLMAGMAAIGMIGAARRRFV